MSSEAPAWDLGEKGDEGPERVRVAAGGGGPSLVNQFRTVPCHHIKSQPLRENRPFIKFLGNVVKKVCVSPSDNTAVL